MILTRQLPLLKEHHPDTSLYEHGNGHHSWFLAGNVHASILTGQLPASRGDAVNAHPQ